MRVKALKSFISRIDGQTYRVEQDDVLEMPLSADWAQAGLVKPLDDGPETASIKPPERSVTKKSRARAG